MQLTILLRRSHCLKLYSSTSALTAKRCQSTSSEYLEKAVYPPIEDLSIDPKLIEKENWHKKLASLGTYEQKLMELNMPKYYGFYSCLLNDKEYQVNGTQFLKFVARTQVIDGLPKNYYSEVSESSEAMADVLAPHVELLISTHFSDSVHRSEKDDEKATQDFLHGLHRLLSNSISSTFSVTLDPRIEGFWFAGSLFDWGKDRPEWMHFKEEYRHTKHWSKNLWNDEEEPFMGDVCMRSESSPSFGCREAHGLPPVEEPVVKNLEKVEELVELEKMNKEEKEEEYRKYDEEGKILPTFSFFDRDPSLKDDRLNPTVYGYSFDHKRASLIPGFWSGDRHSHWRVLYHHRSHLDSTAKDFSHHPVGNDPLHQQLIISSHTQGLAQAAMLGFTPVNELTYPIVHQNVVSDGQRFNISLHQLNTIALHSDNTINNASKNKLWVSPEASLWEGVDQSGKVLGLNKQLLSQLISLYGKNTLERKDATPYLSDYKYLWNHPAQASFRHIFRNNLYHKLSGRPPHLRKPEMYLWERVYKVEFDTRHMDAKKKFYEGHVRRKLPKDRTGMDFNPKDLRTAPRPRGRLRYTPGKPPKIDTEKLCVEEYKWYKNYYWYM